MKIIIMNEYLIVLIAILLWLLYKLARTEAIFIPLPQKTIDKMLKLGRIRKKDVLYDLGCGDGRIMVTAAKKYGINAVGVEKNKILYWICKWRIRKENLEGKVKVVNGDFFKQNISHASIVTVYLSQKINNKLLPKLERELKKGTRIISANHEFGLREVRKIRTGHFYTHLYKI